MAQVKDKGEWLPKGVLDEYQSKARAYDRMVALIYGKKEYDILRVMEIRAALEGK